MGTVVALGGRWSLDAPLLLAVVGVGALYGWGTASIRAALPPHHRRGPRRWRVGCVYGALLLLLVALESPLDGWAQQLMWAHMVQHLILILLVPPLLLLGDPILALLRGLPVALRRQAIDAVRRRRWGQALGLLVTRLSQPLPAFAFFALTLWAWHWPALYSLALRDQGVHDLEHMLLLGSALLFWCQIIPSRPLRPALGDLGRMAYLLAAIAQNVALSMVLGFAPAPLYAPYAALVQRPGGISALADQQIGAAIMWSAGDLPFVLALTVLVQLWLGAQLRDAVSAGTTALTE